MLRLDPLRNEEPAVDLSDEVVPQPDNKVSTMITQIAYFIFLIPRTPYSVFSKTYTRSKQVAYSFFLADGFCSSTYLRYADDIGTDRLDSSV